jgi:hypothetical protein
MRASYAEADAHDESSVSANMDAFQVPTKSAVPVPCHCLLLLLQPTSKQEVKKAALLRPAKERNPSQAERAKAGGGK